MGVGIRLENGLIHKKIRKISRRAGLTTHSLSLACSQNGFVDGARTTVCRECQAPFWGRSRGWSTSMDGHLRTG